MLQAMSTWQQQQRSTPTPQEQKVQQMPATEEDGNAEEGEGAGRSAPPPADDEGEEKMAGSHSDWDAGFRGVGFGDEEAVRAEEARAEAQLWGSSSLMGTPLAPTAPAIRVYSEAERGANADRVLSSMLLRVSVVGSVGVLLAMLWLRRSANVSARMAIGNQAPHDVYGGGARGNKEAISGKAARDKARGKAAGKVQAEETVSMLDELEEA